ncbi:NADPH-dependent 7-cyano-7-deazaguanine reductase QueF [Parapusillimonas granuli]|uniref:NADPH-dependent 7-cyano-7-deazaguanine reductase n=1 Tax=Parapusillimonas granuli TaxID=380911 RepID=A0A853G6D5_9BURK|nr:NADPH-dependent 7-cyano-7-deazaguanine reductase QueF [Parapusillimonas granuli]MEB2400600.1 NADPH-dependent 7-cyano-7-deazaguanine reductase QueF [Alcaligenaceae bacterium]NYT50166.1 NADPH-dependent 7-cyano-7-deazaguanine reductase QueF [Parapusillimonas granuli]
MTHTPLAHAPLGQAVAYPSAYDPSLLFAIDRAVNRAALPLPAHWHGADIWNAYEVSWLNPKGKPMVAVARYTVPHSSPRLIESKSFKLYLNSYNETRFDDAETVRRTMARDLSQAAGQEIGVELFSLASQHGLPLGALEGDDIDGQDIDIDRYEPAPDLLRCTGGGGIVSEKLVSDLLKSNCPVTGQPDWGSVQVCYTGPRIDRAALLRYIVSLRRHTEFHEHCVETMFCDILRACKPESLAVYARYTRRGGLDINPWRSTHPWAAGRVRTVRQ